LNSTPVVLLRGMRGVCVCVCGALRMSDRSQSRQSASGERSSTSREVRVRTSPGWCRTGSTRRSDSRCRPARRTARSPTAPGSPPAKQKQKLILKIKIKQI
jgi:hypothetical protein